MKKHEKTARKRCEKRRRWPGRGEYYNNYGANETLLVGSGPTEAAAGSDSCAVRSGRTELSIRIYNILYIYLRM